MLFYDGVMRRALTAAHCTPPCPLPLSPPNANRAHCGLPACLRLPALRRTGLLIADNLLNVNSPLIWR